MKKRKFLIVIFFAIFVLGNLLGGSKEVSASENIIASGSDYQCEWSLDAKGTLYISKWSSGVRYTTTNTPWNSYKDKIIKVIIEEDVYTVPGYAFYNCKSLKQIDLRNVNNIDIYAFHGCSSLESIYLEANYNLTIGDYAFYACSSLKEITFPERITIGQSVFTGCNKLESIYAVAAYLQAYNWNIPNTAFNGINATIYYPTGSVLYYDMKNKNFGGNTTWKQVNYGTCGYDARWEYDSETKTLEITGKGKVAEYTMPDYAPWKGISQQIQHIVINDGITELTPYFVEYLSKLETVRLPETLEILSPKAFNYCAKLNNLLIPASVKEIKADEYFVNCTSMTDIYYVGSEDEWKNIPNSEACAKIAYDGEKIPVHFLEYRSAKEPTCVEAGNIEHYAFPEGSFYQQAYDENKRIIEGGAVIPALGHTYGEPEFTWSDDYLTCTASFKCAKGDGEETVACEVKKTTTEEFIKYTATVVFEDKTYTDTKTTDVKYSGKSNDVQWSISFKGHLKIWGKGNYKLDSDYNTPWSYHASEIKTAEVSVTNITNLGFLFKGCNQLVSVYFDNFNTYRVTNMNGMFLDCVKLEEADLSGFNTSSVLYMSSMFYECNSLKTVDVSGFNTSRVTTMNAMFAGCNSLKNVDVSGFNTVNVTDMGMMFDSCEELNAIDITGFNTSKVINMNAMFADCKKLESIDVSGFNTDKVLDMSDMFWGCEKLTSLDISGFNAESFNEAGGMLRSCNSLNSISVPVKLEASIPLPQVEGWVWIDSEWNRYTELPRNLDESILLTKVENPELKFSGAALTLQDNLKIRYVVPENLFTEAGYENPYVIFELNGKETKVTDYTVTTDGYIFAFDNIAPNLMNDTIKATLYAEYNGEKYSSEVKEYSIAAYCYAMLGNCDDDSYAELRTLLVDLLNYGAATQVYTNYKTEELVNKDLTDAQKAWATQEDRTLVNALNPKQETIDNPSVKWLGAYLNLKDSISMKIVISAEDTTGLTVKAKSETGKEWEISADQLEAGNGGYIINFRKLGVGQLSEVIYFTVYDGDTPVSNTLSYSIESYAYDQQNSEDANLAALVKAMMKYGDAAYKYVN